MSTADEWWYDHHNLALVAEYMDGDGYDFTEVVRMLEKPYYYDDQYVAAVKKMETQ